MVLAVALTNTRTGMLQMIYDSIFNHTDTAYENLYRWIWASANEPLYISYVPMGNAKRRSKAGSRSFRFSLRQQFLRVSS